MGKKIKIQIQDELPGSYFLGESLETIFWVKILKFFGADPDPGSGNLFDSGSGMEKIRIQDGKPRSGINISDPQQWSVVSNLISSFR
jgi:hypothetical protein